ncbi:hypothetical protein [uncultured Paenibacillus sp.]|uniref:hypothetical protein n=1 Tax=uncultured Paenibacillus sp. TaxID=227322 RepID=UPI0015AC7882|nr:hypothetical protein [uncultured Paenibacillus sp.]
MKWPKVRKQFPDRWVLFEAISAKSTNQQRQVEELAVISDFDDTNCAWQAYKEHHLADPSREYYIYHTSHEHLEIIEQPFTGVRGLQ